MHATGRISAKDAIRKPVLRIIAPAFPLLRTDTATSAITLYHPQGVKGAEYATHKRRLIQGLQGSLQIVYIYRVPTAEAVILHCGILITEHLAQFVTLNDQ